MGSTTYYWKNLFIEDVNTTNIYQRSGAAGGTVGFHATLAMNENNITQVNEIQFEETGSGNAFIKVQAPDDAGSGWTLTLPVDDGATGYFLQTNGSGVTSWQAAASISSGSANNIAIYTGTTTIDDHVAINIVGGSSPSAYEVNLYDAVLDINGHTDSRIIIPVGTNKWAT